MTKSRIWTSGLFATLLLALFCTWVHYAPESLNAAATTADPIATGAASSATIRTPDPGYNLRSEVSAGVITLSGEVPDGNSYVSILKRATRIYGSGNVVDKLQIIEEPKPEAYDSIAANFPLDLRDASRAYGYAQSGRFVLEGEVSSESAKVKLEANAAQSYSPALKIDSRLTVKQTSPSTDSPSPAATKPEPIQAQANNSPPSNSPTANPQTAQAQAQTAQAQTANAPNAPAAGAQTSSDQTPKSANTRPVRASVKFATSSAILSKKAKQTLREFANEFKNAESSSRLSIVGFADGRGGDAINQKLSERRAISVKAYLTKLGVSAERMNIEAKGSAEPVGDNAKVDGRGNNRRVEVRLL